MKLGDEYFTNAECQFEGTVQMDLEQVDYKALLKSAGIDENTSDEPVLVIKGTFNGLGPVALASKAE